MSSSCNRLSLKHSSTCTCLAEEPVAATPLKAGSRGEELLVVVDGALQPVPYKQLSRRIKDWAQRLQLYRLWLSQMICNDAAPWILHFLTSDLQEVSNQVRYVLNGDKSGVLVRLRAQLAVNNEDLGAGASLSKHIACTLMLLVVLAAACFKHSLYPGPNPGVWKLLHTCSASLARIESLSCCCRHPVHC